MKRSLIIISIILFSNPTHAQVASLKKLPVVNVDICLRDSVFASLEDIEVTITLTNNARKDQRILFDKPDKKNYPWGTTVSIENEKGESVVKVANPEMLSSQLYTEKILKKANYYSLIKVNEKLKKKYFLPALGVFLTADDKLPAGRYTLQLTYYANVSNAISFELR